MRSVAARPRICELTDTHTLLWLVIGYVVDFALQFTPARSGIEAVFRQYFDSPSTLIGGTGICALLRVNWIKFLHTPIQIARRSRNATREAEARDRLI